MATESNGSRVLVVEDSEVIRRVLCLILQGEGYQAFPAPNGQQALALARELRPDAVLLDLGLPDLDGREVLRRLKQCAETGAAAVVIISAHPETLGEAERRQAAAVIAKPFDVDALLNGVARAVGAADLSRRGHGRQVN